MSNVSRQWGGGILFNLLPPHFQLWQKRVEVERKGEVTKNLCYLIEGKLYQEPPVLRGLISFQILQYQLRQFNIFKRVTKNVPLRVLWKLSFTPRHHVTRHNARKRGGLMLSRLNGASKMSSIFQVSTVNKLREHGAMKG